MLSTTRLRPHAQLFGRSNIFCNVRPSLVIPRSTIWLRPTGTKRAMAQHAPTSGKRATTYIYPDLIQVYRAPTAQTGANGMLRIATMVLFAVGSVSTLFLYSNPDASNWWIPGGRSAIYVASLFNITDKFLVTVIVGSAVPMTLIILLCGPWAMSIRLNLPSRARRSAEDLQRFIANVPPDTPLVIQFLRFAMWPGTRQVLFSDLRRLKPAWIRRTNLEHIPVAQTAQMREASIKAWIVKMYFGRYWVVMDDPSGGKGVVKDIWKQLWEQIPLHGEVRASAEQIVLPSGLPRKQDAITRTKYVPAQTIERPSKARVIKSKRSPPPVHPYGQRQKK